MSYITRLEFKGLMAFCITRAFVGYDPHRLQVWTPNGGMFWFDLGGNLQMTYVEHIVVLDQFNLEMAHEFATAAGRVIPLWNEEG